ncbi:MAG: glycosyltransferase family 4 protein [Firmicutes bacterium]|nr:glycosyltransferase family 4 protein [Bacillota bacterium]
MKILITTDLYEPLINGVVTSVVNLKNALTALGHDVRVLTLSQSIHTHNEPSVTKLGSLSLKIIYPGARLRLGSNKDILPEIEEWRPDIIHSQCEFNSFIPARYISKKYNIPLIHTYHTVYEDYTHYFSLSKNMGKLAVKHFSRFISKKCDCIITPTEKVRELLHSYNVACPVEVVPTGIVLDKFSSPITEERKEEIKNKYNIPQSNKIAIFIGRLAKEKNISEILKYWKNIDQSKWSLVIVGDGPYRGELERECRQYSINKNVFFTGMVSPKQIQDYYKIGDVFVSASTSETQGLTYIEALACGLPLLCKKDRCLDGILKTEYNGYAFMGEYDFAEAMDSFYKSGPALENWQRNAKMSSMEFGTEVFARRVERIYNNFLR